MPEYLSRHTHRTAFSNERTHYTMHKRWCSQCVPMTGAANTCTEWMAQSLCAAFCCTCCQPGSSGYVTKGCWHQAARTRSSMRPDWLCRCQHATLRRWRRRRHPEMPDLEDVQGPRRQSPQQRQAYLQKKRPNNAAMFQSSAVPRFALSATIFKLGGSETDMSPSPTSWKDR